MLTSLFTLLFITKEVELLNININRLIRYAVGGMLIIASVLEPFKAYSTVFGILAVYLVITAGTEYYPEYKVLGI